MKSSVSRRSVVGVIGSGAISAAMCSTLPVALAHDNSRQTDLTSLGHHELLEYDAVGLSELIRRGEISAKELVMQTIRRMDLLDGTINAMITRTIQCALDRADQVPMTSLFAGVPTMLKDLVDYAGVRRTDGSALRLTNVSTVTPAYVIALERAGLIVMGKTNTPEFAAMPVTDNVAFGPTRNPWDLSRTAGGSSGGSAAAVAAGYVPIAHGTDGGGSNRIPAACCGLLGMKPSRYRMVSGEADGSQDFFRTHQVITRTVRDSAAVLSATENSGSDARYAPTGVVEGPAKRRLRIGVTIDDCFGNEPKPSVKSAIENVAELCVSLGHTVNAVRNPVNGADFFCAYRARVLTRMIGLIDIVEKLSGKTAETSGLLTPYTVSLARRAVEISAEERTRGQDYFEHLTRQMLRFHNDIDLWLTPVIPMEAPEIGYFDPREQYDEAKTERFMAYTVIANGFGAPAMSVPLSWSDQTGLPIGSHFSAKPGDDEILYDLAFELETARPWADRWAPVSAKFVA